MMQTYFEHYARAFMDGNGGEIERHFAYPCQLVNQAGVDVVYDADALFQHLEGFRAMLQRSGVAVIEVNVRDQSQPDAVHATALVAYTLKDAAGAALEAFSFLYVLVKAPPGDWKIRLAELIEASPKP